MFLCKHVRYVITLEREMLKKIKLTKLTCKAPTEQLDIKNYNIHRNIVWIHAFFYEVVSIYMTVISPAAGTIIASRRRS